MSWYEARLETYFLEADKRLLEAKLRFTVSHSIQGRLRVSFPVLAFRKDMAFRQRLLISGWQGVTEARSNYLCGSITVHYDPGVLGEDALLDRISGITVGDLAGPGMSPSQPLEEEPHVSLPRLKRATAGVALSVVLSGVSTITTTLVSAYLFAISLPLYRRAVTSLVKERKLSFDLLYIVPLTMGFLAGHIVISSIAVWFTYFGDYIGELTSPRSCRSIPWLTRVENDCDPGRRDNNKTLRIMAGVGTVAIGILLIPLPGPGIVVTTVGLDMLAGDFLWARAWLERLKGFSNRADEPLQIPGS